MGGGNNSLSISVLTDHTATKGLIEDAYLPNKSKIGVSVTSSTGGAYDGNSYNNILYTATGTGAGQTWSGSAITLSMNEGTCYAYYPYNAEVSDITAVPVSTSGQVDYMFATPVTVSASNKSAELGMKHALSAVRFMIKNGSYAGTGKVTAATVTSAGLGTSGSLNVKTGEVTAVTGTGTAIGVDTDITLSNVEQNVDVIVVPTGTAADLTLSITLDGKVYSTVVSSATIQQSNCHKYTLTVKQGELALSGVKVGDWGYDVSGAPTITAGGYTVTFAGDYADIAFSNSVSNGTVTIRATSLSVGYSPLEVNSSGGTLSQKLDNDVLTITLGDISSDVTLYFNGSGQLWPDEGIYALTSTGYPIPVVEATASSYAAIGFKVRDKKYQIAKQDVDSRYADNIQYWNDYKSTDNPDFQYISTIDGSNNYGYFQQPDGSYASANYNIASNTSEWKLGALADFSGARRTAYLLSINGLRVADKKADTNPSAYAISAFINDDKLNEGYYDWFIPSFGELAFIYTRWSDIKQLISKVDGFTEFSSYYYWSCSATSQTNTRYINFNDGSSGSMGVGGTEMGIFRLIRHL